ncbi:hypothetical protein Pint_29749 [Pistacia integerrima]|uniref:Uncharacterized protein n=1 Tax=Pistacia integerrima TaxID=434235 RepID=A0ACC0X3W4_9ROSI|nr:hypothetical protein Pint_29749 [Pistacia integerrima]
MSYLSIKEVAQISILSKRWNQLWISFPIFDFDQTDFLIEGKRLAVHDRLKEFMEFVDVSLLRCCKFKFCMHKFMLFISILDVEESNPYIDKWIGLAIEKGIKEFDLKFLKGGDTPYTLPQTIFSARLVTTLSLVSCKLENISDTIRFNSLRNLSLDRFLINEEMVQKLSRECPLLEEMFFFSEMLVFEVFMCF